MTQLRSGACIAAQSRIARAQFGQCCAQALCRALDNADKGPAYIFFAVAMQTKAALDYLSRLQALATPGMG
jgi:hypothetical protein